MEHSREWLRPVERKIPVRLFLEDVIPPGIKNERFASFVFYASLPNSFVFETFPDQVR